MGRHGVANLVPVARRAAMLLDESRLNLELVKLGEVVAHIGEAAAQIVYVVLPRRLIAGGLREGRMLMKLEHPLLLLESLT